MTSPAQHASDTPRTDAASLTLQNPLGALFEGTHEICNASFARQLERELAVAEGALQNIQDETNGGLEMEVCERAFATLAAMRKS